MPPSLTDLTSRAARLKARAAAADLKARRRERADDLARKVVLGAWLLSRFGSRPLAWTKDMREDIARYLTRDRDRELFDWSEATSQPDPSSPTMHEHA
jgi:hypothetical protein